MTTTLDEDMSTTALAAWYGSNRMLAAHVGRELDGLGWVGVAFAGGMSEVPHIRARSLVVNDAHRHVMNLARVVADPNLGPELYRRLRGLVFHPDVLSVAQQRCVAREAAMFEAYGDDLFSAPADPNAAPDLLWAVDYAVAVWMGRSGKAGKRDEFKGKLSTRWNAGGGDSAVRFHSWVRSLPAWRRTLRRCSFTTLDGFGFVERTPDDADNGLYLDPPFPGAGDLYKHTFGPIGQTRLAEAVSRFERTRVVMRFYDDALVRHLYPEGPRWTWVRRVGRKSSNKAADEVLIINGPSRSQPVAVAAESGVA